MSETEQKRSKMEVEIISKEMVKPSSPTPSHLKNVVLSFIDQKHAPMLVPILLFYSAPVFGVTPLNISRLKICLSETLSCFYPLAGRYETWGTTLCNDEGIPFVEARVNCPIREVVGSLSKFDLNIFYPRKEELIVSGVHLAIQINVFTCGGFAIGLYHTHKVTDAVSAALFLRYWAALVAQRYEEAAQALPDFKAGPTAYPPIPEVDRPVDRDPQAHKMMAYKRVVVRSFVFDTDAVARLKIESASERLPNPSRFTAVASFVWQQILMASPNRNKAGRSLLYLSVDLRNRTNPALPKGSMGNLVDLALARADKRAPLPELVAEMNEAISEMKEIAKELQGERRSEAFEEHRQIFVKEARGYGWKDVYIFTAWCKSAGLSDVDFGFGKPLWIVPTDESVLDKTDMVMITDFTGPNGDGFEAWLFLDEQHVQILESNPDFLAFASRRF